MVDIDKAVIARLHKSGKAFEILVDCDRAIGLREGHGQVEDALATMDIYKDVKQDMKAAEDDMLEAFGTKDPSKVAEAIIKDGEIQLTTEHKKRLREKLRKRVVELLHKNAIDSRTGLPHPSDRIERAMEQKKVKIDEFRPAEQQVNEVARRLNDILPIRLEVREISVKVPAEYAGKAFGTLKSLGKMLSSEWQPDGSLLAVMEIPAGMQPEFEDSINKMAQGNAEIKIINRR